MITVVGTQRHRAGCYGVPFDPNGQEDPTVIIDAVRRIVRFDGRAVDEAVGEVGRAKSLPPPSITLASYYLMTVQILIQNGAEEFQKFNATRTRGRGSQQIFEVEK